MIIVWRSWLLRFKFGIVFIICTLLLYYALQWAASWLEPAQQHKVPEGRAIKVFKQHAVHPYSGYWVDRLILFYYIGE